MCLPIFPITKFLLCSKWLNRNSSMKASRELPSKLGWSGLVCVKRAKVNRSGQSVEQALVTEQHMNH